MSVIDRLISIFLKFPGIGLRQARRFVYYLLSVKPEYIEEFVLLLQNLKKETRQCGSCYRFFQEEIDGVVCLMCTKNINSTILIVVEKDIDLENIQKENLSFGTYFVLGGLLSPLVKESSVRIQELVARIKKDSAAKKIKEVVVALSAHPDGDYTTLRIKNALDPFVKEQGLKISTLGRGMSTGTELEYSDSETIKHALENRH
ncbi:MAG: recombination protein RecR [Parcubacteria group bacterium]|nr:recombination protein RecR [Parcubacteria group bacterium]